MITFPRPSALAGRILDELHQAGYTAYLVGGCVRDLLLDQPPKDFDIATSAPPAELLRLFPGSGVVGAHFGVVLVKEHGATVEVATFRSDHAYLDGRRPEGVTFETDPREDALRRDFTINALMMDPRSGAVLDFVGGRADLTAKLIRTVGDPLARFGEDHLRLLRAVRFASRLGFEIEPATFTAMRASAGRVRGVAKERVREELIRILMEGGARRGVELLAGSGLLDEILPEVVVDRTMLDMLDRLPTGGSLALALAVLLLHTHQTAAILARLRFPTGVSARAISLLEHRADFAQLPGMPIAELKRFLRLPGFAAEHLELQRLLPGGGEQYEYARQKLASFSHEELFPPRLLTGEDVMALGVRQGPEVGRVLAALETEQLERRITTREQAAAFVAGQRRSG